MTIPEVIEVLRNFKLDMSQPDAFRMVHAIGMAEEALKKANREISSQILPEIRDLDVLEKAIERYGKRAQSDMAVEEMSELTKALMKYCRVLASGTCDDQRKALKAIIEESADVLITIAQVLLMYDYNNDIQAEVDFKINRLRDRLEAEKK